MYTEAHRSVEDQLLSRQVMIACAAGKMMLDPEEVLAVPRIYQVDPMQKGFDYVAKTPIMLPDGSIPTSLARFEETMGWGKTAAQVMLSLGMGFGRYKPSGEPVLPRGTQSLHLEPTSYLVDQAKEAYARFAPGIVLDRDVIVTTYQYAIRAARREEFTPSRFALIHSDEAHRTLGSVTLRIMNYLQQSGFHFGWSGTPGFDDDRTIAHTLPDLIDRTSIRDGMLHPDPRMRFLSGIRIIPLRSGESINEMGSSYKSQDYAERHTQHLSYSDDRNSLIINAALHGLASTRKKGIIKATPGGHQRHAHILAATLSEMDYPGTHRKINAQVVGITVDDSIEKIRDFCTTNHIDIAIYNEAFREGVDIQELGFGVRGPTCQLVSAAQFIGRGLRPNRDGSPFSMYQIMDDVIGRKPIYPWDVIGMANEEHQGMLITPEAIAFEDIPSGFKPNGAYYPPSARASKAPEVEPLHIEISGADLPVLFFADAIPPEDLDLTHRHIDHISETTGLEQGWLRTLFSSEGDIPSSLTLINGEIGEYYSLEVEDFLRDHVAQADDLDMVASARELGCQISTLRGRLERLKGEIIPIEVYPRVEQKRPTRLQHLTAVQRAILAEKFPGATETTGEDTQYITVREVSTRIGKTFATAQASLLRRRFGSTKVPVGGARGTQEVDGYDRSEVEAWLEAYINAKPAPKSGYTDFSAIRTKHRTIFGDVCLAARSIGLEIPIFTTGRKGLPSEHVADTDLPALEAALVEILLNKAERRNQEDSQKRPSKVTQHGDSTTKPAIKEGHTVKTKPAKAVEEEETPVYVSASAPERAKREDEVPIYVAAQATEKADEDEGEYVVVGPEKERPVFVSDFIEKRSAGEAKPQYTNAELIREGYGIRYFSQGGAERPHIDVKTIAHALYSYGSVSADTIIGMAKELRYPLRHEGNNTFLSKLDADKLISRYVEIHGAPAAASIPLIELSKKLRCNPLSLGYLLNNHPNFSGDNWGDHLGEKLIKDEDNITRVGKNAAARLMNIVVSAQKDLGSNLVFIGVNLVKSEGPIPNVYASFPKNLHSQIRLCDIRIKDGEKLQLVYGSREVLRYATTRRKAG